MRSIFSVLVLVGGLALLGSDCSQELFAPIGCENDTDCEEACQELCNAAGDEVMSSDCDANGFCDCLCMRPTGTGGSGGTSGTGGASGSGGTGATEAF